MYIIGKHTTHLIVYHQIIVVTMKMKLNFPKHKTESRGRKYDWAILENKEIKDIYYVEVQNILQNLRSDNETITKIYEKLTQAKEETEEEQISKKAKTKQLNIERDQRIIDAKKNATYSVKRNYSKIALMKPGLKFKRRRKSCKILMIMLQEKCFRMWKNILLIPRLKILAI